MKKPTSEFTPEHALPTESEKLSCPWWSAKTPSPELATGVARCSRGARNAAAPPVALVNAPSSRSRSARYGRGQASSRDKTGSPNGTIARAPKSSKMPPATNSGRARRSSRIAQKYFDQ